MSGKLHELHVKTTCSSLQWQICQQTDPHTMPMGCQCIVMQSHDKSSDAADLIGIDLCFHNAFAQGMMG